MATSDKYVRVRIGKMTYRLSAGNNPQRTCDVAATADAMMQETARKHGQLNQVSQAVLALVNAVGLMEDFHDRLKAAYGERDFAYQAAEEIKAELIRLREQFWQLKKELLYHQNLCEIYEEKLSERQLLSEEEDQARRARGGRKTRMGDYQITIEDALPDEEGETSDA